MDGAPVPFCPLLRFIYSELTAGEYFDLLSCIALSLGESGVPSIFLILPIHLRKAYAFFKSDSCPFNFATVSLARPMRC